MTYTPVEMDAVVGVDRSDAFRVFGPAYEVRKTTDSAALGVVWREVTVDAHGREVKVWWWATKVGARMKVLRESSTRKAAALLLG